MGGEKRSAIRIRGGQRQHADHGAALRRGSASFGVQPASSQEFTFRARPRTLFFPVTFDELPTESLLNLNLQDRAGLTQTSC